MSAKKTAPTAEEIRELLKTMSATKVAREKKGKSENTRWSNEQEFKFGAIEEPERKVLRADELPIFLGTEEERAEWEKRNNILPELTDNEKESEG